MASSQFRCISFNFKSTMAVKGFVPVGEVNTKGGEVNAEDDLENQLVVRIWEKHQTVPQAEFLSWAGFKEFICLHRTRISCILSCMTKPEDSPVEIVSQAFLKLEVPPSLGIDGPGSDACSFSYNSEASDPIAGSSEGSSNSAGKSVIIDGENQYYYEQNGTPKCTLSGFFTDWKSNKPSYCSEGLTHNLSSACLEYTAG
ncbi:hypothetical protein POM88_051999 [Heracleum sosnowskyi]|uniref:Uncharacterized protein n=1 Tax=Heracleum sosnowskyi TaxID=360622 RepID=A0AAD8GSD3_9APIA|nr:hypothetical protein POM88_051999 [Heracleum sosnowskyi]